MSAFWKDLILYLLMAMAAYFILSVTKKYILKTKIKKWHVLLIIILLIFLPVFTYRLVVSFKWIQYFDAFIIYYFLFLYIELIKIDKIKKNAPVIGRPKPNVRRAKNNK